MSEPFFIKDSQVINYKEALSKLELKERVNITLIDSVVFDKGPIDFGVVVADTLGSRRIWLKVNFATFVSLKIKGDIHFKAALMKEEPPQSGFTIDPDKVREPIYRKPFPDFENPLLVAEYLSPVEIINGPGDTFFDAGEFQAVGKTRLRLVSAEAETPRGKRVVYQYHTQSPQTERAPMKGTHDAVPASKDLSQLIVNQGSFDLSLGDSLPEMNNVFPDDAEPYYIEVLFDAPKTAQQLYTATLIVSFDEVKVAIPLTARTGDIAVELDGAQLPEVKMGDSVLLPLRITNFGNMPAEVSFADQSPKPGFSIPKQTWTVPANQQSSVSLLINSKITSFYNGKVSLNLKWDGNFNGNYSEKQTLQAALMASIKAPFVSIATAINVLQGSDGSLAVNIGSNGPPTTFYFQAEGLPDGITMNPTAVPVYAGQMKYVFLTLHVSENAMVSDTFSGPALSFKVLYSAYDNSITGSQTVDLTVNNVFVMQWQERPNWCWAAVAASIFDYYGALIQQCTLVDKFTDTSKGGSCCVKDSAGQYVNPDCDHGGLTEDALGSLGSFVQPLLARPLTLEEVIAQIDSDRPIAVTIAWKGGGFHAVTITGYIITDAGATLLIVEDPWEPSQLVLDINTLTTAYPFDGTWVESILTKPPAQG